MVQDIRTLGLPALRSFHTVARLGGISAAAERLGMAKSGVSRHVSQLEQQLDVKLFERGARSVKLTPVGARLDARIGSILAEVDLLGDIAREDSADLTGHVTIAATPEFGGLMAREFFPKVRTRHPGLTLSLRPAYEFEDMQDPGNDIAIRVGSVQDDWLVARRMGAFRCWIVAAPDVAQAHPIEEPQDLENAPCLVFRGDRTSTQWTLYAGDDVTQVTTSGPQGVRSFGILLDLALAGQGFAILPEFMLGDALDAGTLVRCLPDHVSRQYPVYLTFRPGARRVARIDAVISAAEALLPSLLSED